VGTVAAKN